MCVCSRTQAYSSSLSDGQWALLEPLLPVPDRRRGGRQLKYDRRRVVDTILYVLVSDCSWRQVPHDLVPWSAAYRWFRAWTADGTWDRVHDVLRERVRTADGRDRQPSATVSDSQSPRSPEGSEQIDGTASLSDGQWALLEPLLPVPDRRRGGRQLKYDRRRVVDTILYVLVSDCSWRQVPHDLVPWSAAYRWFRAWTADGTWDRVHDVLRERVRTADGRDRQPSATVSDSQSPRSPEGSEQIRL